MKARDVMVSPVITVNPNSSIREVAKKLLENRISAVPVVDDGGKLVGMISEGDLMHRSEAGTERQRSWWLRLMAGDDMLAADYAKAHGRKVVDVMTQNVITATPNMPFAYISKYSSHTFPDQGLGDGATDAISRAGHKCCFARWVERIVQDAHICKPYRRRANCSML